jgi:lysophospholipase L1-like esterase
VLFLSVVCLFLTAGKQRPIHIYMAGDSTMAEKPLFKMIEDSVTGEKIKEPFPERGWGQMLPGFFDDDIVIDNFGQNGRSTRTFMEQGWWQYITTVMRSGDYVVIQFGHNDASKDKIDRYTPPEDYKNNLRKMVDQVREKDGTPILCTPVVRRRFDKEGKFYDVHGEYPDLVRQVAKEKNVLLIDMHKKSEELLIKEGDEKSKELFLHLSPGKNRNYPNGVNDNTHFNEKGATIIAGLFIEGLKELNVKQLIKELK